MPLSVTKTKVVSFFCKHIVISHVHMQQNLCRTKGARHLKFGRSL